MTDFNIEDNWQQLKRELTPAQQADGRACYYMGMLCLFEKLYVGEMQLDQQTVANLARQMSAVLNIETRQISV